MIDWFCQSRAYHSSVAVSQRMSPRRTSTMENNALIATGA